MKNSSCGHCKLLHSCVASCDKECWETIRADAIDELAEKIKEEMKYYQLSDENIDEIVKQLKEK